MERADCASGTLAALWSPSGSFLPSSIGRPRLARIWQVPAPQRRRPPSFSSDPLIRSVAASLLHGNTIQRAPESFLPHHNHNVCVHT